MYVSLLNCGPKMLTCFQFLLPSAKMREFAFSFHGLGASITINDNNINNKMMAASTSPCSCTEVVE